MKFMISWIVHEELRKQALTDFAEMDIAVYKSHHPDSIKLLGRWLDLINVRGFALCEADNGDDLAHWLLQWNDQVDFDIAIVHEDDEAHRVVRGALAEG